MSESLAEKLLTIMFGTYMVTQSLLSLGLGLYLIVYHSLELLYWAKGGELLRFPVAAALHIVAGLLLFKLANYIRQWPMIRAFAKARKGMVNSQ